MARIKNEKEYNRFLKWSKLTPSQYLINRATIAMVAFTPVVIVLTIAFGEDVGTALLWCFIGFISTFLVLFPFKNLAHRSIVNSVNEYESRLRAEKDWKPYKDKWGYKIEIDNNSHVSISTEDSVIGKGFHITTGNIRLYFDNEGNCWGDNEEIIPILQKLNSLRKRKIITPEGYDEAITKLRSLLGNKGMTSF